METVRSSVLCQALAPLWLALVGRYPDSVLCAVLRGVGGALCRWWDGSALVLWARREGVLTRAWPRSVLCTVLMGLVNLPTLLLQFLYRRWRPVFEGSVAARIGFAIVEQTPLAVGWLMLIVMVIPFKYWNNAYSFGGFILCTILAVCAGMRKPKFRLDLWTIGPWLVAFTGLVLAAWPTSLYVHQSQRYLPYHITCMMCVLVIVSTVERRGQLVRLMTMASLALGVMACSGFYQRIVGVKVNPSYVDMTLNKDMPGRVYAFYENPNTFAEVLVLLIPVAVALMLCSRRWSGRFLGFGTAVLACGAMAMTYSRAAWVGLAFAAFLFVLLWKRKLMPVFLLVAFAGLAMLPDTVFHRILTIFNTSDTSTNSRFPLYYAAADLISQRPLTGVGLGTDAVRSAISDLHLFHGKDHFVHCHDIYLEVWCELGLIGLIAFVGGIFGVCKRGIRAIARTTCRHETRLAVIGSVTALAWSLVCGLADYPWHYPRVMLIFWFVAAIGLAGIRLAAREDKQAKQEGLTAR